MLPCVCPVKDHRGRQNAERISVTHLAAPRVPLFFSYRILMSSVIYFWTEARQRNLLDEIVLWEMLENKELYETVKINLNFQHGKIKIEMYSLQKKNTFHLCDDFSCDKRGLVSKETVMLRRWESIAKSMILRVCRCHVS